MLHTFLAPKVTAWFARSDCPVAGVVAHIEKRGALRDAQIEAIKTYLFLKIEGDNRPLATLFEAGFFANGEDLSRLHISEETRRRFAADAAVRALYEFSRQKIDGNTLSPQLAEYLRDHAVQIDCAAIARAIFYGVGYPDYLFSLPMGAGKTFLMAAFIYLDLYFASLDPDNKAFAHNFIVLAPSGLKSSIVPSLKTIENFDATWVLPEPSATQIKKLIHFELLDAAKSGSKSNLARNPNARKINGLGPLDTLMGLVLVTNAEKVILDKLKVGEQPELPGAEDDVDAKVAAANELRAIIGKIPNLQILIDEVHHATNDDIKLRQVVTGWAATGNVNGVLGFSGTPYPDKADKIEIENAVTLKFSQITNTVFYYPLTRAIQKFLKKPRVNALTRLDASSIVRRGVEEFFEKYGDLKYRDGSTAKLAIYCGSIERLENEVYPLLVGELKLPAAQVLKYHRGNKEFGAPDGAELQFATLDSPASKIRVVLLVQIGKEGWDWRSLTGVVLSQKGDCPSKMVLQTSCRCLREVVPGELETAGIWLNEENARILDRQLREEQHISIEELNALSGDEVSPRRERASRLDHLELPPVEFYQMCIDYSTMWSEDPALSRRERAAGKIAGVQANQFDRGAESIDRELRVDGTISKTFIKELGGDRAHFDGWLADLAKESFGAVSRRDLEEQRSGLKPLFDAVTVRDDDGTLCFNGIFDHESIGACIRLAFHRARELQTTTEVVPKTARLLVVENLQPGDAERKWYPDEEACRDILRLDAAGESGHEAAARSRAELEKARKLLEEQGINVGLLKVEPAAASAAVEVKDRSFQHLPYDFTASNFEKQFLKEALARSELAALELYYNGERSLTEFKIECAVKESGLWKRIGVYTPDFLLVERKRKKIFRALIIETKGSGFADQKSFVARKRFVEDEFLRMNEAKFGYRRFEYLYLSDAEDMTTNLQKLCSKAEEFFAVNEG